MPEAVYVVCLRTSEMEGRMRSLLVFSLLVMMISSPARKAETESSREETVDKIVIEKAARLLTLYHGQDTIRTYSIALGVRPAGKKQCHGDMRTPEGQYVIDWRNRNSRYHRSLHISYPNDEDRLAAKNLGCDPGGNIMIHGLPKGLGWMGKTHSTLDWTAGCIAVTNEEIEEIWDMVPDGTPVEISP